MVFCQFARIHVVLVRGFRSGIGVRDLQSARGFADVRKSEMNVAGERVVLDRSFGAGLRLDPVVVFFIVRPRINRYPAEMAIKAVRPIKRDVVIRLRPWLLGVNLRTVI